MLASLLLLATALSLCVTDAFTAVVSTQGVFAATRTFQKLPYQKTTTSSSSSSRLFYQDDATTPSDVEENFVEAIPVDPQAVRLKQEILKVADETQRGFVASSSDRNRVHTLISELMQHMNSKEPAAAYYDDDQNVSTSTTRSSASVVPTLVGKWTLVYTDAPDITSLNVGAPFTAAKLGRIGQECKPPFINNIIEWRRPGWAAMLPLSGTDDSRILIKVCTKASATSEEPTKVNLQFVGFDLVGGMDKKTHKKSSIIDSIRSDGLAAGILETTPVHWRTEPLVNAPFGSFEVLYLDEDMRIVRTEQGFFAINVRSDEEWF